MDTVGNEQFSLGEVVDYDQEPDSDTQPHKIRSSGNFSPIINFKSNPSFLFDDHQSILEAKVPKCQKFIKKRSRRCNTVFITTDPSNFRAYVQQLTGVNSSFPYTVRPSAQTQKVQKKQRCSVEPNSEEEDSSSEGKLDIQGLRFPTTPDASGCLISNHHGLNPNELVHHSLAAYPSRSPTMGFHAEHFVELNFSCSNLDKQPWLGRQRLSSLRVLDFSNSKLMNLPDLSEAKHLRTLVLQRCKNLVEVSSIQYITNLEYLNLKGCTYLRSLPSMMNLKFLHSFDLSYCSNLRRLPLSIGCLSRLTTLDLKNCRRIQNLPVSTFKLKSLKALNISGCSKLIKHMSDSGMEEGHLKLWPQVPPSALKSKIQSKITEAIMWEQNVTPQSLERSDLLEGNCGSYITKVLPLLESISTEIDPQAARQISAGSDDEARASLTVESAIKESKYPRLSMELAETIPTENLQSKEQKPSSTKFATHIKTCKPSSSGDSCALPLSISVLQEQMRTLEIFMDMSVEAIHQVDAFENIGKIMHTLFGQISYFQERRNIEQIICFLGELKESIPETIFSVTSARKYRALLQGKLMQLGISLDESQKQYNLLDAELTMLSEEEARLDVEIQALVARKEELLDQKISHARC